MVAPGAYAINPNYAMSIDVNLGRVPGTKKEETVDIGKGPSITISAVTDRRLTNMLLDIAREKEIPNQISVSPTHTGTNAVSIQLAREGIPTVDVGLPLASMHTYNEVIRERSRSRYERTNKKQYSLYLLKFHQNYRDDKSLYFDNQNHKFVQHHESFPVLDNQV